MSNEDTKKIPIIISQPRRVHLNLSEEQAEALFEASRHVHTELDYWTIENLHAWQEARTRLMIAIGEAQREYPNHVR